MLWGYLSGGSDTSQDLLRSLAQELSPLGELPPLALAAIIFLNNTVKALAVLVLGLALGLIPFIFVVTNGVVIGIAIYQAAALKGAAFTALALAPHGIFEIPALLLAVALGFQLGEEVLRKFGGRPAQPKVRLKLCLSVYLRLIMPVLAFAAAIEVVVGIFLPGMA